ncbi:corticotropin-releasing factor-binding protein-like isoform X2 [Stigmatopora argus]
MFRPAQLLLLLLFSLTYQMTGSRHIRDAGEGEDNVSAESRWLLALEREKQSEDFIFQRPLRCLDMLATEGHFTFTASAEEEEERPTCATFIIGEPGEVVGLKLSDVNVDCDAGDFIKIFDGWVLQGENFPSSQDHPLPLHRRYTDICSSSSGAVRSSQNVAAVFFRVRRPGGGFTLAVEKLHNPWPCNIVSQSPEGSFTMVLPHQNRNCSFSVIYPVEIEVTQLALEEDQSNQLRPRWRSSSGCLGSGDYLELLGGNGVDTSRMFPVAALCFPLSRPAQIKMACDNSVVRLVSSGNYVNRVSFRYRLLPPRRPSATHRNGLDVDDVCNAE